jgi:DNA mismatch repair ATPase MutS
MCFQVFRNNSDGTTEGSLFQIMNNTCTSFGSRLLRNWVRLSMPSKKCLHGVSFS